MIKQKTNFLINNKNFKIFLVFSFSILHGFLYFYPDLIQNLTADETKTYLSFHHGFNHANYPEITYGPSIRRIFDFFDYGFLNLNNPTSFNSNSSANLQILPFVFGGFLSYLLGGVENFFYLKNFIFPTIGFLLSFLLLKIFFKSFFLSLFGSIFFYNPFFALSDIYRYFTFDQNLWANAAGLSNLAIKYPYQQFSSIVYFIGLISLFKILENKNYKYLLIFSITVSAYSYFYDFVVLGMMTFFIFIYAFIFNLKSKKDLFISGLISMLLSLPIIIISALQSYREDMLMAFYFTQSQNFILMPYFIKSLFMGTACILIIKFYDKSYHNLSVIILFQLLPLIILSNLCYYFFLLPEPQHFILNYGFSKVIFILMIIKLILNLTFLNKIFKNVVFVLFCITSIFLYANTLNWQIKTTKLETDLYPAESKEVLNWISSETQNKATILSLDPLLLHTIPTLTGRYNYIPSLNTLTPTSINSPIAALKDAKKILGLNDNFDKFINSSCEKHTQFNLETFCDYTFYSYFSIDKGSFSYLLRSKEMPENLLIPEKNRRGEHVEYISLNLEIDNASEEIKYDLPEYIIIGPVEKEFINNENYLTNYQKIFSTENYQIFRII